MIKKNNFLIYFITFIIISTHYLYVIISNKLGYNDFFFLSFGYPSDPVVFPLIKENLKYIFSKDHHFSNILFYLPEFLIFKYIGFDYIWITSILYKYIFVFSVILLFLKFNKIQNFELNLIFSTIITIILLSNQGSNTDRLVRPSLSNIFYAILIINLLIIYYNNSKISKFLSIIIGLSSAATLSMNPWGFFFICPLFILIYKNISFKNLLIGSFFFIIIYLPNIKFSFDILYKENLHLEYLGLKEIFNLKIFLIDFFLEAIKTKKIIFGATFIITGSLFIKKKKFILIFFFSIFFGFLPYIITLKTILSYHILWGLVDYIFIVNIFLLNLCISKFENNNKKFQFKLKNIYVNLFIIFSILVATNFKNQWIERVVTIKNLYSDHFFRLKNINNNYIIVSNDKYIRAFLYLNDIKYKPIDGFTNINSIEETLFDMKKFFKKNQITNFEICMYLKSSTENLFDATRSTKSKILNYNLNSLYAINSTSSWKLSIPDYIKENIKNNQDYKIFEKNYFFYDKKFKYVNDFGSEENKCLFEK
jgi:hypothetical protein